MSTHRFGARIGPWVPVIFSAVLPLLASTEKPDNIILIVIDTLRADHLGVYGYEKPTSPNLNAFAMQSTVYDSCFAQAPWTQPSIATIFTSRYPTQTGIHCLHDRLDEQHLTLAEILKGEGYQTTGIYSHTVLRRRFGFGQGFDTFENCLTPGEDPSKVRSSHRVTKKAVDWLREHGHQPFFLFLHYFDPHYDYLRHPEIDYPEYHGMLRSPMPINTLRHKRKQLQEEDLRYLVALYDGEIRYTDQCIGLLFEEINALNLQENTLIIVTADHGEEFMTHGWIGHTRTLYHELIHVPLIVRYPRASHAPRRIKGVFELADILPTILNHLGLQTPSRDQGTHPFVGYPLPRKQDSQKKRYAFSEVSFVPPKQPNAEKSAVKRSITDGSMKLIYDVRTGSYQYFDLEHDPLELDNRYDRDLDEATAMQSILHQKLASLQGGNQAEEIDLSAEEIENLRSLGYIQ